MSCLTVTCHKMKQGVVGVHATITHTLKMVIVAKKRHWSYEDLLCFKIFLQEGNLYFH